MFTLDPDQAYVMPAHFGPRYTGAKTSGWYHDVTAIIVPYLTDRDLLAAYIPPPYQLPEEAVLNVYYACNRNIDWLAGHGYNMIAVNTPVTFQGKNEVLEGTYSLVIWENLTDPILVGREVQGIPKVYADIPDHSVNNAEWRVNASHFGHKIIDMSLKNAHPVSEADVAAGNDAMRGKNNPMAWRFIPALGGYGSPRVNEATTFPSEDTFKEIWVGEGHVDWQQLAWEQNPTQYHIVNALNALPVLEYRPAMVTKGSTNLVIPDRLTRSMGATEAEQ